MSETPTSSEPATSPLTPAPPVHEEPRRSSRLNVVAAWVGIVAGVVFIVAVIFFSGFFLGAHSGGHHGWRHHGGGDRDFGIIHKGGPPPMFPMGPRGEFDRPWGPGMAPPQLPQGPGAPSTTGPARP